MTLDELHRRGLVLLGCGKMGSALLAGWLAQGMPPSAVWVIEPHPSDWLRGLTGVHLNAGLPEAPGLVLVAVKPQMMTEALPGLTALGNGSTLFVSIAAGVPIARFEAILGSRTPIIRAMPNTPAAVGKGITALIGNEGADADALAMTDALLSAVGQTVRLEAESQMDAVTALSGSGPAYVFHLIETMAAAGVAQGLAPHLAMQLAKATVAGAGHLAETAAEDPAQLRVNVTSPGGTTAAALKLLMDPAVGLPPLMARAIAAAADRSRELGA